MNAKCRTPVPVPCSLNHSQSVIQSTTAVSSSQPIFCICFRQSALLSHFVKSRVIGPPSHRPSASELSQRIVHTFTKPISVSVELHCCCPRLEGTSGCFLPLFWLSLLFDGCICHFGLLFQIPFCKWRWFKWRWRRRRRRRQSRTAATATATATATPFPGRRKRLPSSALRAMSLALERLILQFFGSLSTTIACSLQSFVTFGGRRQHCFQAGTALF